MTMKRTVLLAGPLALCCVGATACGSTVSSYRGSFKTDSIVSQASTHALKRGSSPKPGTIYVFTNVGWTGKGTALVTGVIGDLGRQFPANKNGKPDSNANYAEVVLRHGTFLLDERALTNGHWSLHNNLSDCSSTLISQHPVPVLDGTGKYAGISGTIAGVATEAVVVPRYKSGKFKGQCSQATRVGPARHVGTMNGSGSVTF